MSLEHSPARSDGVNALDDGGYLNNKDELDYWHTLIDEREAAVFLDLTHRTMQAMRQRGDGPRYVVISSRCIRYRRENLKSYADQRVRTSTSDPGPEATE